MADPAYDKSRSLAIQIHQKEHRFTLYLREGDGEAKRILGRDATFGYMGVFDWAIHDGPGKEAKRVARAQGQRLGVGSSSSGRSMLNCFSLTFEDKRFHKSSLKVLGEIGDEEGECAIIGGTGKFAYAQGIVVFKKINTAVVSGSWTTKQLEVCALCSSAMLPIDQPVEVEHSSIDSGFGALPTNPSSQGDRDSGRDGSPTTPSPHNNKKRPADQLTPGSSSSGKRTRLGGRKTNDPPETNDPPFQLQ